MTVTLVMRLPIGSLTGFSTARTARLFSDLLTTKRDVVNATRRKRKPRCETSPCSKVRDVTRWGASPGFSISHYITVSNPSGGVGGRGLVISSTLSTRRASGDPAELPDRGVCASRRNVT
jgi:hypothetical protein